MTSVKKKMKQMQEKANKELKELYTEYLEGKDVKEKASQLHQKYLTAKPLLDDHACKAINRLVDIYAVTGVKRPDKEEAQNMIDNL